MPVTHHEVISITELLACDGYSPTVCYIYSPCPKAGQSLANLRAGEGVSTFCVLASDSVQGFDEIGVLLVHETGALWHGFTLTSEEARLQAPYNNATSLQVVAGIIGALTWMLEHPREGVVEAENMDATQVLATALPYLGKMTTIATDWRPGHALEFDEFLLGAKQNKSEFVIPAPAGIQSKKHPAKQATPDCPTCVGNL
jgi:homospermidine synthase